MGYIKKIDDFILGLFTKFSHWFQRLTGKTNFWLAYICLSLWVGDLFVMAFNYWIPLLHRPSQISDIFVSLVVSLISIRWVKLLDDAERQTMRGNDTLPKVSLIFNDRFMEIVRVAFVLMTAAYLPQDIYKFTHRTRGVTFFIFYDRFLLGWFYVAFLYFAVVRPMPPGKSRVKEWIDGLVGGFRKLQPARGPSS